MKKDRLIILTMGICVIVSGFAVGQSNLVDSMDFQGSGNEYTLEEAIETMLKDNSAIENATLELEQANVDYDKGKKDLKKSEKYFGKKREDSIDYLQNITLLELSTEFTLANANRNYKATIEEQKADVEELYFLLLQAEELVEINKQNLEVAEDLYERTKRKLELGLAAKQEVLNSELSYIQAENEYKSSLEEVKEAKMMMNLKLGNDIMTEINLVDELKYNEFDEKGIASAVSQAWGNRNEIKAAEFNYDLEDINMRIAEKKYSEITFAYRAQKIKQEQALKELENTKKNIELEVRSNYLDILQKKEDINSGEKSVELAEEVLRLTDLSYDVGMNILTDVQTAQATLKQAKLGLSKSILDYNVAILKFEDSIGIGRTSISIP